MNGAPGDRVERLLERRRFAEAVEVQRDLDVVALRDRERGVDDRRERAGVLVHLEAAGAPGQRILEERLV